MEYDQECGVSRALALRVGAEVGDLSCNERSTSADKARARITIHEDVRYRGIIGRHLTEADIVPHVELIRLHRRVLGRLLVDQSGGILGPYPLYDAVRQVGSEDPELGAELMDDLLAGVQFVEVADLDGSATFIRAVSLSLNIGTTRSNLVIADEVFQRLRWIRDHRSEIDRRNPSYTGCPVRAGASWIAGSVGVDNKRVERIYRARGNLYGLEEYADLPSLGADWVVQKGAGALRGRPRRAQAEKTSDTSTISGSQASQGLPSRMIEVPRSHPPVASLTTEFQERVPKPDEYPAGPHPAVEAVRMAMLGSAGDQGDSAWPLPEVRFTAAVEEIPPPKSRSPWVKVGSESPTYFMQPDSTPGGPKVTSLLAGPRLTPIMRRASSHASRSGFAPGTRRGCGPAPEENVRHIPGRSQAGALRRARRGPGLSSIDSSRPHNQGPEVREGICPCSPAMGTPE